MKYKSKILITISIVSAAIFSIVFYNAKVKAEENVKNNWKDIPAITMKLYDGKTKAIITVNDIEKYHNGGLGIGPGVALGYRACQIAFSHLYKGEIPKKGDQFVVCGTPRDCPGDAVTYITGARFGKGSDGAFNSNLAFDQSIGSFFNFIFASMSTGKAIKLVNKYKFPKEFSEAKSNSKKNPKAKEEAAKISAKMVRRILTASANDLFEVVQMPDFKWKEYKEKYSSSKK